MIDIQDPPPIWNDATPPTMVELRLLASQVNSICRLLRAEVPPGRDVAGCAVFGYGGCLIIVPKIDTVVDRPSQDRVRAHETAHCNGWQHETQ